MANETKCGAESAHGFTCTLPAGHRDVHRRRIGSEIESVWLTDHRGCLDLCAHRNVEGQCPECAATDERDRKAADYDRLHEQWQNQTMMIGVARADIKRLTRERDEARASAADVGLKLSQSARDEVRRLTAGFDRLKVLWRGKIDAATARAEVLETALRKAINTGRHDVACPMLRASQSEWSGACACWVQEGLAALASTPPAPTKNAVTRARKAAARKFPHSEQCPAPEVSGVMGCDCGATEKRRAFLTSTPPADVTLNPCECGGEGCAGPEDNLRHQCGGPAEACGVAGCPECTPPADPAQVCSGCGAPRGKHLDLAGEPACMEVDGFADQCGEWESQSEHLARHPAYRAGVEAAAKVCDVRVRNHHEDSLQWVDGSDLDAAAMTRKHEATHCADAIRALRDEVRDGK